MAVLFDSIANDLKIRGLWNNCTDETSIIQKSPNDICVYVGFDLTAPSLHVGNLTTLMLLRRMLNSGCRVIVILGGATTKIGDPSGKNSMRKMLNDEEINANKLAICKNILTILSCANEAISNINLQAEEIYRDDKLIIVDNSLWFAPIVYIDFLREIGSAFSVNNMLTMDSVKSRIGNGGSLTFLEFNYMIMQAYDFYQLHKKYGCNMQAGGSDQWGNIIQGIDLIGKKLPQSKVYGLTIPILTRSDGAKMGKTENGAIWMTAEMLHSYDYFQYFRNVSDSDVDLFLNLFTDLSISEIKEISILEINQKKNILAFEATKICHGLEAAIAAKNKSILIFQSHEIDLSDILFIAEEQIGIVDLVMLANLSKSRSDAKRLIEDGGIKINGTSIDDCTKIIDSSFTAKNHEIGIMVISAGKKRHVTVRIGVRK